MAPSPQHSCIGGPTGSPPQPGESPWSSSLKGLVGMPHFLYHPQDSFLPPLLVHWVMVETSLEPPRLNSLGLQLIVQVLGSMLLAM